MFFIIPNHPSSPCESSPGQGARGEDHRARRRCGARGRVECLGRPNRWTMDRRYPTLCFIDTAGVETTNGGSINWAEFFCCFLGSCQWRAVHSEWPTWIELMVWQGARIEPITFWRNARTGVASPTKMEPRVAPCQETSIWLWLNTSIYHV